MSCHRNELGQTTFELLTTASLLMITVSGMGYLFKAEWDRGKCAYLVFEKTHAAAVGGNPGLFSLASSEVRIHDSPDSTKGIGFCRGTPETISIPKLETEQ
jgi:hypothetical protein